MTTAPKDGTLRLRFSSTFRLAAFLAVIAGLSLGACSTGADAGLPKSSPALAGTPADPQPRSGGTLAYALPGDPQNCDLHMTGGMAYQSVHPCNTMLSQLVRYSAADHSLLEPDLALNWDVSADGRTWTFHLRDDVTWHDGTEFDSDDVVFSLSRVVSPPPGLAIGRSAPFAAHVPSPELIQASSKFAVSVTTQYPWASFLENVASVYLSVYPRQVTESKTPASMARFEEVVGTGPFRSHRTVPGVVYEVVSNDSYYEEGRPYLDGLNFRVMPDSAVRLAALQSGQVDVVPIITESEEEALSGRDEIVIYRTPSGGGNTLQLNLSRPPFDNPGVRRAMNLAVSRDEASLALGDGYVGAILPPGGGWAMPQSAALQLPGYGDVRANRVEARRLLAEAGYADGFDLQILTRANFFFELLSDFAAGQLAEVGIRAEVVPMEPAAYQAAISNGDFSAVGHSHSFPLDDPDAILAANYGCNGAENYPGLCDPALDSLIEQQSRELDETRRRDLLHEIESRAWNHDAKIWLQWSARRTAVNFRVHGMAPGGPSLYQGVRLDLVWME